MSEYSLIELSRMVRDLRAEIAEESAVLSQMYVEELDQRTDGKVSEKLLAKSREVDEKIERCMVLWQELKERVARQQ